MRAVTVLSAALLVATACGRDTAVDPADVVLRGGVVHTVDAASTTASALAISGERIVFVGSDAAAAAYVGEATTVVELDGRMVLPGLIDGHVHPVRAALKSLYDCSFPFTAGPDEIAATLARCVSEQPDATWIRGGQWDSSFFERYEIESPRAFLDAVSGDKAVYLADDSLHNAWVNTRALELGGFDAATPDPAGGRFERGPDGYPNGVLVETAPKLMLAVMPKHTAEQQTAAAAEFSRIANAFGITGAKAAAIYEEELAALQAADLAGELNVRMAASIRTVYGHREEPLDYAWIESVRDRYASPNVDTRFAKLFLDGVPTAARTAAMLEPYVADELHGAGFDGGPLHIGGELLARDLIELDRRGFTVKMHTAGDRSVRVALDAIAAAREANGASGLRHELAHAGYVHPDDLPRFAELDAVADLSPVIWHPSPIIQSVLDAVGRERGERYWPVRSLLASGAPVLAGSDWPAGVPDANPWVGIEAFVTRRDPRGVTPGTLWADEAVPLADAIAIYTIHGARALRLDDRVGSLEPGKLADLIVLDRNLLEVPVDDVSETRVLRTYVGGRLVYDAGN